jgi:hypothetical protein
MNRYDIEYVLEILGEAIESQDWELVKEAQQYLEENLESSKYEDEE